MRLRNRGARCRVHVARSPARMSAISSTIGPGQSRRRICLAVAQSRGSAMIDDNGGFGVRLRALRLAAGISQQELAERSGMSVRAISNLERGRTRWPYRHSLKRIADSLGLTGAQREAF